MVKKKAKKKKKHTTTRIRRRKRRRRKSKRWRKGAKTSFGFPVNSIWRCLPPIIFYTIRVLQFNYQCMRDYIKWYSIIFPPLFAGRIFAQTSIKWFLEPVFVWVWVCFHTHNTIFIICYLNVTVLLYKTSSFIVLHWAYSWYWRWIE